jgi:hypothetical protein
MRNLLALLCLTLLAACATQPAATAPVSPGAKPDLAQVTHADLLAAAARATKNGYPARAQMWSAIDTLLTAQENQAQACLAAIKAALPAPGTSPQFAGAFDAIEAGAEFVGTSQGVPAVVKLNCLPLPIPTLPALPGIPKL